MATYIAIPSKRGYDVDLIKPLRAFIQETYGSDQASAHANALDELQNMRNKLITKLADHHESTVQLLQKYHDQIFAIETKIPIAENGVRIDFKWQDAFAKESLFGSKSSLKISSSGWERMCILFNLAALYSQLGEGANFSEDKGLQTAAKYFQQAAGIFSHLKHMVTATIQREPTLDMSSDALMAYSSLMLAQAQDCIYRKAVKGKISGKVTAKIAMQAADLYADALKLFQLNSLKHLWPKEWLNFIAGKQAGFHALTEYYASVGAAESKSFGEQIARLKKATELMKSASSRAGAQFMYKDETERIKRDLESAEKENNMIYHEPIPDYKSLPSVEKAVLAKEIQPEFPLMKDSADLFDKLVPMIVHQSMVEFDNQKKAIASAEVGRLREATDFINTCLASLNLPAGLEDSSGSEIPPSLLEKSQKVRAEGGIAKINEMMQNLPDLLKRNREILNESIRMLDEERESDNNLRQQFKERWTRTPSDKLTESWRTESAKFSQILEQATSSDAIVRERFQKHENALALLSKSESELKAALPKSSGDSGGGSESLRNELRGLCQQVEELKEERKQLENEINNINMENMGSQFMTALAQDGAANPQDFNTEKLNELFAPVREKVRESLSKQENLLSKIQSKNTEFVGGSGGNGSGNQRAQMLSEMATAYDQFEQLLSNLNEGTKFYSDLTQIFLKFQSKVNDFTFARKTEKDDLMKDVQSSIVREKTDVDQKPQQQFQSTSPGTGAANAPPSTSAPLPQRPPPTYMNSSAPSNQPGPAAAPPQQAYGASQPNPVPPGYGGAPPPQPAYGGAPNPNLPYPIAPQGMPAPYMAGMPPAPSYMNPGSYNTYTPGYPMPQQYPPQQPPYGYPNYGNQPFQYPPQQGYNPNWQGHR